MIFKENLKIDVCIARIASKRLFVVVFAIVIIVKKKKKVNVIGHFQRGKNYWKFLVKIHCHSFSVSCELQFASTQINEIKQYFYLELLLTSAPKGAQRAAVLPTEQIGQLIKNKVLLSREQLGFPPWKHNWTEGILYVTIR